MRFRHLFAHYRSLCPREAVLLNGICLRYIMGRQPRYRGRWGIVRQMRDVQQSQVFRWPELWKYREKMSCLQEGLIVVSSFKIKEAWTVTKDNAFLLPKYVCWFNLVKKLTKIKNKFLYFTEAVSINCDTHRRLKSQFRWSNLKSLKTQRSCWAIFV